MSVQRTAAKDAQEYARAQMFYGEGAGVRRRLIETSVDYKAERVPGYAEAFQAALDRQDMAKHAEKAQKERGRKDLKKKADRNTRALVNHRRENLTTGVAIVGSVWMALHQTGADKEIWEWTKVKTREGKVWVRSQVDRFKGKPDPVVRPFEQRGPR